MTEGAGVLRSADSLAATAKGPAVLGETGAARLPAGEPGEATNLHPVASALVAAAARREETRGAHWREDFPIARRVAGHLVTSLDPDGEHERVPPAPR